MPVTMQLTACLLCASLAACNTPDIVVGDLQEVTVMRAVPNRDLSSSLDAIGATAKQLIGDPCIDTTSLADTSADPGVQPACEVTDVSDAAPDRPTPLPACASGAAGADCYRFVADNVACPAGDDHLRVRLQRSRSVTSDIWTHVRCQRVQ